MKNSILSRVFALFSLTVSFICLALGAPSVQAQTFTLAGSNPMPTLQFGGRIFFIDVDSVGDADLLSQNGNTAGTGIELRINNGNGTFANVIGPARLGCVTRQAVAPRFPRDRDGSCCFVDNKKLSFVASVPLNSSEV